MPPIDPNTLPPVPAPLWFVELFKGIGFFLHMIPMNLWFAGIPVALIALWRGGEHSERWSKRFLKQAPLIMAFGINFGIVPLLFVQLVYYKPFYSATILMAWHWIALIALVVIAYYGVYAMAFSVGRSSVPDAPKSRLLMIGVGVSAFLIFSGFILANAFSLMAAPDRWDAIYQATEIGGAVTGGGLNAADPSMWARFVLMFGLALVTTAVWIVCDSAWLVRSEEAAYRAWAKSFATNVALAGAAWSAISGSVYLGLTWPQEVRAAMFSFPTVILTGIIGVTPLLPAVWLFLKKRDELTTSVAAVTAGLGVVMLALNVVGRQIVQNVEVGRLVNVLELNTDVQWSPLLLFLVVFVAGLGVIGWMLAQLRQASPS